MTTWAAAITANGPHSSIVQQNGRLVRKYQRSYWVGTDKSTVPTESEVMDALGIDPGSPYENDLNATCRGITSLTQKVTRPPHCAFDVTVEWSTDAATPNEISTDPASMRVVWGVRPRIEPRSTIKDRHNKLITNAAGSAYEGGIPVNVRMGTAVAKRTIAFADYDAAATLKHSGKLNSETFLDAPPGTLQVDIEAEERWQGAYHFVDQVFTFNYDPEGHQPKPANAGFFQLKNGGQVPITVGDLKAGSDGGKDPTPITEPEPLYDQAAQDGSGSPPTKIKGTIVPVEDRPDGCSFVTVDFFAPMDFADFGLV